MAKEHKEEKKMRKVAHKYIGIQVEASVELIEDRLVIKNNNDFEWINSKMEINSDAKEGSFLFVARRMLAQKTYTIGLGQFINEDGMGFDLAVELKNFSINCKTPKGDGIWYGNFD